MIRLRLISPVNFVAAEVLRLFRRASIPVGIEEGDVLLVVLCPSQAVESPDGAGFGAFRINRGRPEIWLAGEKPEPSMSDADHAGEILEVLSHEVAHYEQWRDGREIQERGVAVRARTIARKIRALRPSLFREAVSA